MNQLETMRAFARVAEFGSFTRAAEALDLSRAVVSAQVQALERHLGVALFARTTRRVTLTGDGSAYLDRCRRILDEIEVADDEMRRSRERVQGRLKVDMPAMFGRYLLLPELPAFTTRYPELQLDIQYNDRVIDLGAEGVDVAVRFAARRDPRLITRPIGATRLLTCAAPSYLLQQGAPQSIEDLRHHRLIGQRGAQSGRARDWLFRVGTQTRRIAPASALVFNSVEGALQAATSGMGLIQTADIVIQDLVRRGLLEVVLAGHATGGAPVSVVYQRARRIPARVRVFADFTAGLFERWNVARSPGAALAP